MQKKPIVIGVIPSRYGSTRLPAKPLIDLCGKPMVQQVYERAKQATLLDKVVVATDHRAIVDAVLKFNGEVMMTPDTLRSGSDRCACAAKTMSEGDIFVNIQGDEPLIAPQMIDEAIRPLLGDSEITMGTLVKKITAAEEVSNPNIVKVVLDEQGFAMYFSRSAIPHFRDNSSIKEWHKHHQYYKHIGLYVFRKETLLKFSSWGESKLEQAEKLEQLRALEHGVKIKATVTAYDSIPIDTTEDVEKVKQLLQQMETVVTA
jgi:3-deoxy-manno-octulosonate cytidylyltransferase (CMP-KDO synthetase)